jgi:hypothetical protein
MRTWRTSAGPRHSLKGLVGNSWRGLRDLPRMLDTVDYRFPRGCWEQLASPLEIIADAVAVSMYSKVMNEIPLRGSLERINRDFFRYNGMERWNRSLPSRANTCRGASGMPSSATPPKS